MTIPLPEGPSVAVVNPRSRVRGMTRRVTSIPEMTLLILCVIAFILFTVANKGFATGPNIESLFLTIVYTGIVAVGEAVVMIVGEFDLSVGSVAGMGAIVGGLLMTNWGFPVPAAIAGGVAAGAVVGLVNGFITVKVGIPAFITTLSMLYMAQGIGYVMSGGNPVYPLPPDAGNLARTDILGIPSSIWAFLLIVVVADLFLRFSTWGRIVYATGGNPLTTRLAGISITKVKILAFTLGGALASFGGIMLVSRLKRADASIGQGWELIDLAVRCFVRPGRNVAALAPSYGMYRVQQGLVIAGVDANLQPVVAGMILIGAVGFDLYRRRRAV